MLPEVGAESQNEKRRVQLFISPLQTTQNGDLARIKVTKQSNTGKINHTSRNRAKSTPVFDDYPPS